MPICKQLSIKLRNATFHMLQNAADLHARRCTSCSLVKGKKEPLGGEVTEVLVVTWGAYSKLRVRTNVVCAGCGACNRLRPWHLDCFPGTPVAAWEARNIGVSKYPVWFAVSFLKQV
jgi:hypothetical protein